MAITYADISGKVTQPGTTVGIPARITAYPETTNHALRFPDDATVTWGGQPVETDDDGNIPVDGLKVPIVTGIIWTFVVEALYDPPAGVPRKWTLGRQEIAADTTIADLAQIEVTAVDAATLANFSDLVSQAQAVAKDWQPNEAVTTGSVRQAPDGSRIKSTANRTTRSSFDATEQGFWTPVSATSGTLEQVALSSSYVGTVASASVANGTTDDRAAIATADTSAASVGAAVLLKKGTHRVASNLTITSPVHIQPGAVIKPDSGVTVTLNGGIVAGTPRQMFDHSAGGIVVPNKAPEWHPGWWGAVNTSDDSQTWTYMMQARDATSSTRRNIRVPEGESRLWGVSVGSVHLQGAGHSSIIKPALAKVATWREQQFIYIVGKISTLSSFTLTYSGQTTTSLAYGASASTVQAALNALSNVTAAGGVTVTGDMWTSMTAFTVKFGSSGVKPLITASTTTTAGGTAVVTTAIEPDPHYTNTGYVLRTNSQTQITGGNWHSDDQAGITLVYYTGGRSWMSDFYVQPRGAKTIGVFIDKRTGGSITGRLLNGTIISQDGSGNQGPAEQQSLYVTGSGLTSFTVTYGADTTGSIAAGASAATVQTALNALASITSAGGVTVTGADGGYWVVKFNVKGTRDLMTATSTGGTGVVNVARIMEGGQIAAGNSTGIGVKLLSPDCELTNVNIGAVDTGVVGFAQMTMSNCHIWGCKGTGLLTGDNNRIVGGYIESNGLWGIDAVGSENLKVEGCTFWRNGWDDSGGSYGGGVRLSGQKVILNDDGTTTTTGLYCENNILDGVTFDDNFGIGVLIDRAADTELSAVHFVSGQRQLGVSAHPGIQAYGDYAIKVTNLATGVRGRVKMSRKPYNISGLLNEVGNENVSIEFGRWKNWAEGQTFTNTTAFTNLFNGMAMEAGDRWEFSGYAILDGPQTADASFRVNITGSGSAATGWWGVGPAPRSAATSTTVENINPINAGPVGAGGKNFGLIGAGSYQMAGIRGYVTCTAAGTLVFQFAPVTADVGTVTIQHAHIEAVQVGIA